MIDEETASETWWRATFPVGNPVTSYRWVLAGGDVGYGWVNGVSLIPYDVPDADDFVLSLGGAGPAWHIDAVVYQIFPDRFATSGRNGSGPSGPCRASGTSCLRAAAQHAARAVRGDSRGSRSTSTTLSGSAPT